MTVLLLAGLGPYFKSRDDLVGSYFDRAAAPGLARTYRWGDEPGLSLDRLSFEHRGRRYPLLRPERSGSLSLVVGELAEIERTPIPNLTAFTLQSIFYQAGIDFEYLPLDAVWDGDAEPSRDDYEAVVLSTTFICDRHTLARAIGWVAERLPRSKLVVGGQYSNLKYAQVLRHHPEVVCVVRGDGERALPGLLFALRGRGDLDTVPNLTMREPSGGTITSTDVEYVDLEAYPSPAFPGRLPIVPYESMRGCPFSCKFCSFPSASPRWRYKSARKIADDWARYRDLNGATHIRALDSTFTVPPARLRELLQRLPGVGIGWEAFSRANTLGEAGLIDALARAHCRTLSIGFESMSEHTLTCMNKRVTAAQNRRAFELLRDSPVGYRVSLMVGYPGEAPEHYRQTHDFLVHEYAGHFQLYVFSLQDETMPVWEDAERFRLQVRDLDDPDYAWVHVGMDADTARSLRRSTLRDVRWKADRAVSLLWQTDYQTPLMPHRPPAVNYRLEKLVERLGMLPLDYPSPAEGAPQMRALLAELRDCGVSCDGSLPPAPAGAGSRRS